MFDTVLIANRGEIALRILRACRSLGLKTVAIHSEADRDLRHVQLADKRLCIGPAPARDSYLNIASILLAPRRPGQGPSIPLWLPLGKCRLRRSCREGRLVFIGPPADVIRTMGDKIAAKEAMRAAGVPCVPGSGRRLARGRLARAPYRSRNRLSVIVKASAAAAAAVCASFVARRSWRMRLR